MGNVTERMCASCEREIENEEEMITVEDVTENEERYLCDSDCLVHFLQTHGIIGIPQGRV